EADCIYGDVVLRNDRITAVIARPVAGRHANMTVRNVGGAIIDLTSTSEPNDQLSAYYPGGPGMNWRSMTIDAGSGEKTLAEVEAGRAPLRAAEVRVTCRAEVADSQPAAEVTYILVDGDDWLRVESTFSNDGQKDRELVLKDEMRADTTFEKSGRDPGRLFSVYDKWFRQAYGIIAEGHDLRCQSDARNSIVHYLTDGSEKATLAPGKKRQLVRRIAPAPHLLALQTRAGKLLDAQQQPRKIVVRDTNDAPLTAADVVVRNGETIYGSGRTGQDGAIAFTLPDGEFEAEISSLGSGSKTVKLAAGENLVSLPAAGSVVADIRDSDDRPIACKVQFRGKDGAKDPDFGHQTGEWAVRNARYSEQGQFRQPLPPGKYQVIVSHGPEYDALFTEIEIVQGRETPLTARLARSVQTPGWISGDFHNHASPSGDNTSSQLGRVLNLLAEHIEFAPCTEHNRLSSYEPHLVRLKATEQMGTCVGIELTDTPLPINHHNAFPLVAKPHTQDNGGPLTDHDMEVKVERLAMWDGGSEKLVQQNHPDVGAVFFDKDGDGQPDSGFRKAFGFFDVIEVHPPGWIFQPPVITSKNGKPRNNTVFNWLQLLNQGRRIPGVVNTDAHYNFHGSGFLRIYVQSPTDEPAKIQTLDVVHACEQGHIIMTNGPFLEVNLWGSGEKVTAGSDAKTSDGKATLAVRVQCANWFDIDRVQVFLNGSPRPELNFTRRTTPDRFGDGTVKFDQQIALELSEDTHVIVAAAGEGKPLGDVMGPDHARDLPIALSNPIFVDVDGGGFKANGDTLGAPLPVTSGK
ncbi:MAG TPA: CehA/McbA family metallohydrolase, partial [Pirellulales bacterium]|nr:CehA/McbA family metallohydrolase [Pirellulales bacterium]